MSRPTDWWPLCGSDPVPGDPQTLATLGGRLGDAAAEIESMARTLPTLCTVMMSTKWAESAFSKPGTTIADNIAKHFRIALPGQERDQ